MTAQDLNCSMNHNQNRWTMTMMIPAYVPTDESDDNGAGADDETSLLSIPSMEDASIWHSISDFEPLAANTDNTHHDQHKETTANAFTA
eukprot:13757586-Ditylum_brightwellii.AAC.1